MALAHSNALLAIHCEKIKNKRQLSKLANDREKVHPQIGEKYQLQLINRFA